jgi:hypothetical protein
MLTHHDADRIAARLASETGWYLTPDGATAAAELTDYIECDDSDRGANLIGALRAARSEGMREASTDVDRQHLGRLEGACRMAALTLAGTPSSDETRQIGAKLGEIATLTAGQKGGSTDAE